MARIYFRRYKERIDAGEITVAEAVVLAEAEVPARWRDAVVAMLNEYSVDDGSD